MVMCVVISWALFVALQSAYVTEVLRPGVRVTLDMGQERKLMPMIKGPLVGKRQQALVGRVVLPTEPRARTGTYWGYSVRIASGLSEALSASPYEVCSLPWWCSFLLGD